MSLIEGAQNNVGTLMVDPPLTSYFCSPVLLSLPVVTTQRTAITRCLATWKRTMMPMSSLSPGPCNNALRRCVCRLENLCCLCTLWIHYTVLSVLILDACSNNLWNTQADIGHLIFSSLCRFMRHAVPSESVTTTVCMSVTMLPIYTQDRPCTPELGGDMPM